jgi:hypothetical protein
LPPFAKTSTLEITSSFKTLIPCTILYHAAISATPSIFATASILPHFSLHLFRSFFNDFGTHPMKVIEFLQAETAHQIIRTRLAPLPAP